MKMSSKYNLIFFIIFICKIIAGVRSQDTCGQGFKCKFIEDCKTVQQGSSAVVKCGNDGKVCCPKRISEIKCEEYQIYVYDNVVTRLPGRRKTQTQRVEKCGTTQIPLIVGGVRAGIREFPHMTLLGYKSIENPSWECGGSVISPRYILTAAHCLKSNLMVVRVGEFILNSDDDDADPEDIPVKDKIKYPDYKSKQKQHDIGLVELARDIKLNIFRRPACLSTSLDWKLENAIATGWGREFHTFTKNSDVLMKVKLEKFSENECKSIYKEVGHKYSISYKNMICAGSHHHEMDTCQGDSGGPLQIYAEDVHCMYSIIGVTAFGVQECGTKGIPGIYTNVAAYIDWIEGIVWKA